MGRQGRYSPELRERAVRMVFEHQGEHDSQWATISSIAGKIGCTTETLRNWVRQAERDTGKRPGWMWEKQMAHFAKTNRVVAMGPRSQGESSQTAEGLYTAARARDIKAVMDQLKLAPVVLVGWSMGVAELAA